LTELGSKIYTVQIGEAGIKILDADGNPCPQDECRKLATRLSETYAPGAHVYIGKKIMREDPRSSTDIYKIGMTTDLVKRQQQLKIRYIHIIPCPDWKSAQLAESILLQYFDDWAYRITGEWFWLDEEDLELIESFKNSDDIIQFQENEQVLRTAYNNPLISVEEVLYIKRKCIDFWILKASETIPTEAKLQELREFEIYLRQVAARLNAWVKKQRELQK
jgi:T5orf172 domain